MAASASSALVLAAAALPEDDALLDEEELPEDDPEDPELEEVEAVEDEVEAEDSPALSVAVCEAVSQAATKKATATSAIRRCNMVMLPVLVRQKRMPGLQLVVYSYLPKPLLRSRIRRISSAQASLKKFNGQTYPPVLAQPDPKSSLLVPQIYL